MGGLLILQPLVSVHPLQELVEYYQCHSLKESFKQLDTTLKFPYKSRERATTRNSSRSSGNVWAQGYSARPLPRAKMLPVHLGRELLPPSPSVDPAYLVCHCCWPMPLPISCSRWGLHCPSGS